MKLVSKRVIKKQGWMYDDLKDKKIVSVANKEDGSIISAIKFSNGKIRMKSKMSFESEQAVLAQEYLDAHPNIQNFIEECIKLDKTPIFELVGYNNCIVLNYSMPSELILLQVRDNKTGKYEDLYTLTKMINMKKLINKYQIKQAKVYDLQLLEKICANHSVEGMINSIGNRKFQGLQEMIDFVENTYTVGKSSVLDLLLLAKEYVENEEGEVITFEDGQMAKIKQNHYLQLHSLIGPDSFRENILVRTIISGNIDDVISALVPGTKKDKILEIEEKVIHKYNELVQGFLVLRESYFNDYNEVRKDFAIARSKEPMFGSVIKSIPLSPDDVEKYAEQATKDYIEHMTNSLSKAKEWIKELKVGN